MICEICDTNDASISLGVGVGKESYQVELCDECASQWGIQGSGPPPEGVSVRDFLVAAGKIDKDAKIDLPNPEVVEEVNLLHEQAMEAADKAFFLKRSGSYEAAAAKAKEACDMESRAAQLCGDHEPTRGILFRSAATLALDSGNPRRAEVLAAAGIVGNPPTEILQELRGVAALAAARLGQAEMVLHCKGCMQDAWNAEKAGEEHEHFQWASSRLKVKVSGSDLAVVCDMHGPVAKATILILSLSGQASKEEQ